MPRGIPSLDELPGCCCIPAYSWGWLGCWDLFEGNYVPYPPANTVSRCKAMRGHWTDKPCNSGIHPNPGMPACVCNDAVAVSCWDDGIPHCEPGGLVHNVPCDCPVQHFFFGQIGKLIQPTCCCPDGCCWCSADYPLFPIHNMELNLEGEIDPSTGLPTVQDFGEISTVCIWAGHADAVNKALSKKHILQPLNGDYLLPGNELVEPFSDIEQCAETSVATGPRGGPRLSGSYNNKWTTVGSVTQNPDWPGVDPITGVPYVKYLWSPYIHVCAYVPDDWPPVVPPRRWDTWFSIELMCDKADVDRSGNGRFPNFRGWDVRIEVIERGYAGYAADYVGQMFFYERTNYTDPYAPLIPCELAQSWTNGTITETVAPGHWIYLGYEWPVGQITGTLKSVPR